MDEKKGSSPQKWINNGYIIVKNKPQERRSSTDVKMPEHIKIMEKKLGRVLKREKIKLKVTGYDGTKGLIDYEVAGEVVHHRNGIKTDNRIENLKVMERKEHYKLHAKLRSLRFALNNLEAIQNAV